MLEAGRCRLEATSRRGLRGSWDKGENSALRGVNTPARCRDGRGPCLTPCGFSSFSAFGDFGRLLVYGAYEFLVLHDLKAGKETGFLGLQFSGLFSVLKNDHALRH